MPLTLARAGETVTMKMAKEQERQPQEKSGRKEKKSRTAGVSLAPEDQELFEKLRNLRTEIAREEQVPPYIVFSDKTLVSMCMVKPGNRTEMLSVSGVGAYKYDKYGERFLARVREVVNCRG